MRILLVTFFPLQIHFHFHSIKYIKKSRKNCVLSAKKVSPIDFSSVANPFWHSIKSKLILREFNCFAAFESVIIGMGFCVCVSSVDMQTAESEDGR